MLDYEQVNEKLTNMNKIKKSEPLGLSTFGLPISHYTYGNGINHVVISGAIHGSEIITTDLVLYLMENIPNYIDNNLFTIHFIPILNPEGYLISTSAIRSIIPREMPMHESQQIIKKYIKDYNAHDYSYQNTFSEVDYTCIPNKYDALRNNIKKICETYNIPKGTLQVWSSNGNGIDLNQNCPFNKKLEYIKRGKTLHGNGSYGNIVVTKPGPIGCPSKKIEFEYEPETKCFRNFLLKLKHNPNINLCAYLNYHSAENTIFYKPLSNLYPDDMISNIKKLSKYNENIAKKYSTHTSHELYNGETKFCCFNDMLRLEIPGDILIELCPTEGNPLSAYDDTVYKTIINENLLAAIETIKCIPRLYKEYFKL